MNTYFKIVCIILFLLDFQCVLAQQKTTIGVVDFDTFNISRSEGLALTNRLRNEISRLGGYDVLGRSEMEKILKEFGIQLSSCSSDECLVKAGKILGARIMVGGSFSKVGDIYSVSARVIDTETSDVLAYIDYDFDCEIGELLRQETKKIAYSLFGKGGSNFSPEQDVAIHSGNEGNSTVGEIRNVDGYFAPELKFVYVNEGNDEGKDAIYGWSFSFSSSTSSFHPLIYLSESLVFQDFAKIENWEFHLGLSAGYAFRGRGYYRDSGKFFEDERIYLLKNLHAIREYWKLTIDSFLGIGVGYGAYRDGAYRERFYERTVFKRGKIVTPVLQAGIRFGLFDLKIGVECFITPTYEGTIFYAIGLGGITVLFSPAFKW